MNLQKLDLVSPMGGLASLGWDPGELLQQLFIINSKEMEGLWLFCLNILTTWFKELSVPKRSLWESHLWTEYRHDVLNVIIMTEKWIILTH